MRVACMDEDALICEQIVKLEASVEKLLTAKTPEDQTLLINSTVPYVVDYRGFKYIYLYTANALTLSLADLGSISVKSNSWVNLSFQTGLHIFASNTTVLSPVFVRCTDDSFSVYSSSSYSVGLALAPYASNAAATGIGTDVTYKFGVNGTTQFNHCSIQNDGAISVLYSFDVPTTTAGAAVYTLAPGQLVFWDRAGTVLHFQTASAVNFNGTSGITVEAFA